MIRVLLVDDEPMVCALLTTILSAAGDINVVGQAHDGVAAVNAVVQHRPDVVLMDLRMPGVDGITATRQISRMARPPAVVALTTFDADAHVQRALRAGAVGFVVKSTPPEDLVDVVRVVADGHTVLSPAAARSLLFATGVRADARAALRVLTPRERDVLAFLGQGLSNADIGVAIGLSEATVKGHVSRVLSKLDCANRTQAALLAYDAGLVNRRGRVIEMPATAD
ncbi:response regulator transcription factor [Pilimelia columellifera]|uniref:Response regulator transcription factor n=1 Tax=Pilimelia columellifera subsp. columellifera TaxID=706583 RepID=A0ABP6AY44_9ACTN